MRMVRLFVFPLVFLQLKPGSGAGGRNCREALLSFFTAMVEAGESKRQSLPGICNLQILRCPEYPACHRYRRPLHAIARRIQAERTRTVDVYRVSLKLLDSSTTYTRSQGLLTRLSARRLVPHRAGHRVGRRTLLRSVERMRGLGLQSRRAILAYRRGVS
jgi:hypothetical protein